MQLKSTATSSDAETPADTNYFRIPERWLKRFPRLIGFSCLLLIELAVLQLKVYEAPALSFEAARGIFIILFLGYLFLNNILDRFFENKRRTTLRIFYVLLMLLITSLIALLFLNNRLLMPFEFSVVPTLSTKTFVEIFRIGRVLYGVPKFAEVE